MAELGLREELEDGRSQHVRGGVTQNFQCVGILLGDELELDVGLEWRREIDKARRGGVFRGVHRGFRLAVGRLAVAGGALVGVSGDRRNARGDTGRGEARRDGVGDIERRCAGRHFADGPVGQVYGDRVRAHMRDGNLVRPQDERKMRPTFENRRLRGTKSSDEKQQVSELASQQIGDSVQC